MKDISTDLLVIGGGATGAGVAWDAALRGYRTVLADSLDLGQGTSGRFHGMLHSGGRYAVKDPRAARECIDENKILRKVATATIEDTGGLFVSTPQDPIEFGDELLQGCRDTGVPIAEIDPAEVLRDEPRLDPRIKRAFTVPDASIDAWKLLNALADGVRARAGTVLTYHRCIAVHRDGDEVTGAMLRDVRSGEEVRVHARFTINAAGAWAGQIADLAGIEGVHIVPGRGIMIAMNHRIVNTVVNRCARPADGDILVPIRTVSVIGTTDVHSDSPDDLTVDQAEVDQMLDAGEVMVPGFRDSRALRVWAGVRPLFEDKKQDEASNRDISRAHALLDHAQRDGVGGFITITGGKLTTFRLMAEEAVNAMCAQLGDDRACTTAKTPLPGSEAGDYYDVGARLRNRERRGELTSPGNELICECELISREKLVTEMESSGTTNLDDIRRALRLAMGPCQGGFCIYRATGLLHAVDGLDNVQANRSLREFLDERWRGSWPILHGDQLRQSRLDDWIYQGLLDVEHLPASDSA
ncbi:MAG TPA: anaerobic glycerol-3-phosphate dehydrogenase subunit GlpA [Baekduia sp.]|nr:anaerobic glycerol-3-phosphate dehydrogenase subunit GlpA [Baekduia sp.]